MTCKDELKRRLSVIFPYVDDCDLARICDSISDVFSPSVLDINKHSKEVKKNWTSEFIRLEKLPFEPTEEEIYGYTE